MPVSTLVIAQIIVLSGCHYYNLSRITLICNHIKAWGCERRGRYRTDGIPCLRLSWLMTASMGCQTEAFCLFHPSHCDACRRQCTSRKGYRYRNQNSRPSDTVGMLNKGKEGIYVSASSPGSPFLSLQSSHPEFKEIQRPSQPFISYPLYHHHYHDK